MTILTNKQTKHLRAIAHNLSFVIQTGTNGLTDAVQNEINVALNAHELIKIKLNDEKEQRKIMTETIMKEQNCQLIHSIGKVIILFRRNTNNIKIELPKD